MHSKRIYSVSKPFTCKSSEEWTRGKGSSQGPTDCWHNNVPGNQTYRDQRMDGWMDGRRCSVFATAYICHSVFWQSCYSTILQCLFCSLTHCCCLPVSHTHTPQMTGTRSKLLGPLQALAHIVSFRCICPSASCASICLSHHIKVTSW